LWSIWQADNPTNDVADGSGWTGIVQLSSADSIDSYYSATDDRLHIIIWKDNALNYWQYDPNTTSIVRGPVSLGQFGPLNYTGIPSVWIGQETGFLVAFSTENAGGDDYVSLSESDDGGASWSQNWLSQLTVPGVDLAAAGLSVGPDRVIMYYTRSDEPGRIYTRVHNRTTQQGSDQFVPLGYTGYFTFDGNGDYLSTSDKASFAITGDIDVRADLSSDDIDGSERLIDAAILAQWPGDDSRAWWWYIGGNGNLRFAWAPDGTFANRIDRPASVNPSTIYADGERFQLRTTLDVDNGASSYELKFWHRNDGIIDSDTGWTQLGDTKTGAVTSIFDASSSLHVGAPAAGLGFSWFGKMYGVRVFDGIAGTVVADPDFRDDTQGWSTPPGVDGQSNSWALQGNVFWTSPTSVSRSHVAATSGLNALSASRLSFAQHTQLGQDGHAWKQDGSGGTPVEYDPASADTFERGAATTLWQYDVEGEPDDEGAIFVWRNASDGSVLLRRLEDAAFADSSPVVVKTLSVVAHNSALSAFYSPDTNSILLAFSDSDDDPVRFLEYVFSLTQVIAVGTITESDSLIVAQPEKPIITTVGVVSEADALVTAEASKPVITSVGTLGESDSLITSEAIKPIVAPVGILGEADSLIAVELIQPIVQSVGVLSTIETLIDISFGKTVDIGVLTEFDILLNVQALKPIISAVGVLTGADSLVAIQGVKPIVASVGIMTETDLPITVEADKPILVSVGTVAQVETLLSLFALKTVNVDTLVETDMLIAVPLIGQQVVDVEVLVTIDSLVAIQALKPIITGVGVLAEDGSLIGIEADKPLVTPVGILAELDTLLAIGGLKAVSVGTLAEVASLISVGVQFGGDQVIPVAVLAQTDTLLAIQALKPLIQAVGVLTELDSLLDIDMVRGVPVGTLDELNVLLEVEGLKPIVRTVGAVTETDVLIQILGAKGVGIETLVEIDSLLGVDGTKAALVTPLAEIESLLDIAAVKPTILSVGLITETDVLVTIASILGELVVLYMKVPSTGKRTNVSSGEYDAEQEATVEGRV
jgi:hypothetical protein